MAKDFPFFLIFQLLFEVDNYHYIVDDKIRHIEITLLYGHNP